MMVAFGALVVVVLSVLTGAIMIPIVAAVIRRNYVRRVEQGMTAGSGVVDPVPAPAPRVPSAQAWRPGGLAERAVAANRAASRAYVLAGLAFGVWAGAVTSGAFLVGGARLAGIDGPSPGLMVGAGAVVVLVFAVVMAPLFGWLVVPTLDAIGLDGIRLRGSGWVLLALYLVVVVIVTGGAVAILCLVLLPGVLILVMATAGRGAAWFVAPVCLSVSMLVYGLLGMLVATLDEVVGLLALVVVITLARLRWVVAMYARKRLSDDTLMITQWWFLQALFFAAIPALFSVAAGLVTLAAYGAFSLVLAVRLRTVHRRALEHPPARMLLLRTFGDRRRSTRLLSVLSAQWRWIGSIQVIAGPDLAAATLEPHELLDYLGGRMAGRFVSTTAQIGPRLAALDHVPDRDGRFRVNDVFCSGDAWQPMLQALLPTADVVLIDLRGFASHHRGVIFEIEQLVQLSAVHRVVAVVDPTTSMPLLSAVLDHAWAMRSGGHPPPPHARPAPVVVPVERGGRPDMRRVFDALCRAVAPEIPEAPDRPA